MSKGKIYLLPIPLGEDGLHTLTTMEIERIHQLRYFIAERARTTRRFIKTTNPPYAINELTVFELDKHNPRNDINDFLAPALEGHDIGVMSEAGCPGVADPGALVVQMAHRKGIEVVPLVGPSSLLLALMASGMNGQSFAFQGYLPQKEPMQGKKIKQLEKLAGQFKQTQLFIETPYRNNPLLKTLIKTLDPNTRLATATDLTLASELIISQRISDWRKADLPDLHKRPTVFLIL